MQEGGAVGAGPIVERLERICAHESTPDVHTLASNGGSATFLSIMKNSSVRWSYYLPMGSCTVDPHLQPFLPGYS